MNNNLSLFEHDDFGILEIVQEKEKFFFPASEAATLLGYKNPRDAIKRHCLQEGIIKREIQTSGGTQEVNYISEGNLYRLIAKSKLPAAVQFESWVFDEVLPTMRTNGGYIANAEQFTDVLFPFADDTTKEMLAGIMQAVQKQNAIILQQREALEANEQERKLNESIITSLTDDVEIFDKRALLNQIILKAGVSKAQERWRALYRQFELVYHVRLEQRLEAYNMVNTPKLKSKLDYVDHVMGRIDDIFEICVKLYASDLNKIQQEMRELRTPNPQLAFDFEAEMH